VSPRTPLYIIMMMIIIIIIIITLCKVFTIIYHKYT